MERWRTSQVSTFNKEVPGILSNRLYHSHLFHLVPREICNDVNTNLNLARALPYFYTDRNGSLAGEQGEDEKIFNLVYPLGEKNVIYTYRR